MPSDAPALLPPPEYAHLRWHWIKQASGELIVMAWTISNKWADHVGFLSPEAAWGQLWRYHGPCIPTAIVPDSADEAMVEVVRAKIVQYTDVQIDGCETSARAVLDALRVMGERG